MTNSRFTRAKGMAMPLSLIFFFMEPFWVSYHFHPGTGFILILVLYLGFNFLTS